MKVTHVGGSAIMADAMSALEVRLSRAPRYGSSLACYYSGADTLGPLGGFRASPRVLLNQRSCPLSTRFGHGDIIYCPWRVHRKLARRSRSHFTRQIGSAMSPWKPAIGQKPPCARAERPQFVVTYADPSTLTHLKCLQFDWQFLYAPVQTEGHHDGDCPSLEGYLNGGTHRLTRSFIRTPLYRSALQIQGHSPEKLPLPIGSIRDDRARNRRQANHARVFDG